MQGAKDMGVVGVEIVAGRDAGDLEQQFRV